MDIGKAITNSWNLTLKNIWVLLGAALVGGLLSVASVGLLFPPLAAAIMLIYLKTRRGKTVGVPDIFATLNITVRLLLAFLWYLVLVTVGLALFIIPGLVFAAWWMFAPLFIADQGCGIGEAMRRSHKMTKKLGVVMIIIFLLIVSVIGASGHLLFGVGLLFSVPLALGTVAMAYEEVAAKKKR